MLHLLAQRSLDLVPGLTLKFHKTHHEVEPDDVTIHHHLSHMLTLRELTKAEGVTLDQALQGHPAPWVSRVGELSSSKPGLTRM